MEEVETRRKELVESVSNVDDVLGELFLGEFVLKFCLAFFERVSNPGWENSLFYFFQALPQIFSQGFSGLLISPTSSPLPLSPAIIRFKIFDIDWWTFLPIFILKITFSKIIFSKNFFFQKYFFLKISFLKMYFPRKSIPKIFFPKK